MKGVYIVSAIFLLALASSFAFAFDPSPLHDFCVAVDDPKDGVFVNGRLCKDPKLVKPEDFFFSGLNIRKNTTGQLFGSAAITPVTAAQLPGLQSLGVLVARTDYAPNSGPQALHLHPRASEIIVVNEGTIYAGFVTSFPEYRLFSKTLNPGDVFVFPMGLIHFQFNIGKTPGVTLSAFNSENPGLIYVANATFGSTPNINPEVLIQAYS